MTAAAAVAGGGRGGAGWGRRRRVRLGAAGSDGHSAPEGSTHLLHGTATLFIVVVVRPCTSVAVPRDGGQSDGGGAAVSSGAISTP